MSKDPNKLQSKIQDCVNDLIYEIEVRDSEIQDLNSEIEDMRDRIQDLEDQLEEASNH